MEVQMGGEHARRGTGVEPTLCSLSVGDKPFNLVKGWRCCLHIRE